MLDCQIFGNGGVMNKRKGGRRYPPLPKLINLTNSETTTKGGRNLIRLNKLLCNFLQNKLIIESILYYLGSISRE
tara:strand:- start:2259 stop:2483 length:225 start_codon:yes stop_codon:yes gene_type:complete